MALLILCICLCLLLLLYTKKVSVQMNMYPLVTVLTESLLQEDEEKKDIQFIALDRERVHCERKGRLISG